MAASQRLTVDVETIEKMSSRSHSADVVVVSAGMAGLVAAVTALEHGREVVVLEKGTRAGGSMYLSAGNVFTTIPTRRPGQRFHMVIPDCSVESSMNTTTVWSGCRISVRICGNRTKNCRSEAERRSIRDRLPT
ncbi:MAG: FAD-binding protein [Halodesulfurarchaeum sp.]